MYNLELAFKETNRTVKAINRATTVEDVAIYTNCALLALIDTHLNKNFTIMSNMQFIMEEHSSVTNFEPEILALVKMVLLEAAKQENLLIN